MMPILLPFLVRRSVRDDHGAGDPAGAGSRL